MLQSLLIILVYDPFLAWAQCQPPYPAVGVVQGLTEGTCIEPLENGAECMLNCSFGYGQASPDDMTVSCMDGVWSGFVGYCKIEDPILVQCVSTCVGSTCLGSCISPLNGTANVTIYGTFFRSTGLRVGRQLVSSVILSPDSQELSFITPSFSQGGVYNVTVYNLVNTTVGDSRAWLYYTDSGCTNIGEFWYQNLCRACPVGGYCPGGDRVWPLPGYWSPNQYTPPTKCAIEEACPGVSNYDLAFQDTAICNEVKGYTSDYCGDCLPGYYQVFGRCLTCGDLSNNKAYLVALSIGAVTILVGMAIAVAVCDEPTLTLAVHVIIIFQIMVQILGMLSAKIPDPRPSIVVGYLSIINFDVQFVRPGCAWGGITWIQVFWTTFIVMAFALLLMFIAALFFTCLKHCTCRYRGFTNMDAPWHDTLKRRIVLASQCLFSIIYLQLCLRSFQGLVCVRGPGGVWLLDIEKKIECYRRPHLPILFTIYLFLLPMVIGFPIFFLYKMRRAHHKEGGLLLKRRREMYGFLYRYVKPQYYWVRLLGFFYNFFLALEVSYSVRTEVQLFFAGAIYLVYTILGFAIWPLIHDWRNYFYVIQGYAIAGSSLISLGIVHEWFWFIWLSALMGGVVLWCLGLWICRRYELFQDIFICQPVGPWEDPEKVTTSEKPSYDRISSSDDSDMTPTKRTYDASSSDDSDELPTKPYSLAVETYAQPLPGVHSQQQQQQLGNPLHWSQ